MFDVLYENFIKCSLVITIMTITMNYIFKNKLSLKEDSNIILKIIKTVSFLTISILSPFIISGLSLLLFMILNADIKVLFSDIFATLALSMEMGAEFAVIGLAISLVYALYVVRLIWASKN